MSRRNVFAIVFALTLAVLGSTLVYAWTGPTASPPNGNVAAPLNVSGTGQIKSGGLWVGSLGVDGGASVGTTLSANRVDASSQMRTQLVYGINDTSYRLDLRPGGASILHDVRADIFRSRSNTGYYLQPHSTSVLNDVRASIYYDQDNTNYYLSPNSTSVLNDVRADIFRARTNTSYYLQPHGNSYLHDVRADIFRARSNTGFYLQPQSTSILEDVRANVFYDRHNTNYYMQPRGSSVFNRTYHNTICLGGQCHSRWTFGGMYSYTSAGIRDNGCRTSNPFTGSCSCPNWSPYSRYLERVMVDTSGGYTDLYYCSS